MRYIVAVGDMKIGRSSDTIVTHALGSCLGLVVYDPVQRVGGLLHAMLALSKINPAKAEANPYIFVDTGVPALFKALYETGGQKSRMVIKAAGCGNPLGNNERSVSATIRYSKNCFGKITSFWIPKMSVAQPAEPFISILIQDRQLAPATEQKENYEAYEFK